MVDVMIVDFCCAECKSAMELLKPYMFVLKKFDIHSWEAKNLLANNNMPYKCHSFISLTTPRRIHDNVRDYLKLKGILVF